MDKKKVIKQLEQAINAMLKYNATFEDRYRTRAFNLVQDAQIEIRKSDWVSVEDGLPEYEKDVVVCSTKFPDIVYVTYRENRENYSENEFTPIMDDNDFILNSSELIGKVTHWKPIEKLEE